MSHQLSRSRRKSNTIPAALAALVIALQPGEGRGDDEPAAAPECGEGTCIFIDYEEALTHEARMLGQALSIRLARHGVGIAVAPGVEPADNPDGGFEWVVHLRGLSDDLILLAIDNLGTMGDDVVKQVQRAETAESTAWTMAIMVEEAVHPYIGMEKDEAALGAGLAIIEPPAVGGVKRHVDTPSEELPRFRSIALALTIYGVTESDSFVAGPRIGIDGLFAKRLVAGISIAWAGWADFVGHGITGSMSLLPLDVTFGFLLLPNRLVELSAIAGLTVGFAIYKTSDGERDRTDLLFEPCGQVSLRAVFHIVGPWTVYVDGGLAVPFVKDVLENAGRVVYEQPWGFPVFSIGIQLWL